MSNLPPFKTVEKAKAASSPEELFKLLTRAKSHGYLRGEQQDILRDYASQAVGAADVALELPTGTGKTCVGLLIAEWWRRNGVRAAYLSLTNQLAAQVLQEAKDLGIPAADLRGDKDRRVSAEETRFKTRKALGVSTYANLFNVNPVIKECNVLVLDDAHGGAEKAVEMWSIEIAKRAEPGKYDELLAALRSGLSSRQYIQVTESDTYDQVELADVLGHPDCLPAVREALKSHERSKFTWQLLGPKLRECLFLVSPKEIVIRPLAPPTFTHVAFRDPTQRIYMSATLGSAAELERGYGVIGIKVLRVNKPQWGRRYIFAPSLAGGEQAEREVVAGIWAALHPRRALLIAPSRDAAEQAFSSIAAHMSPAPNRLGATDIESHLTGFTNANDSVLVLAGRYDGLDLPDDDCRLLILVGSPAAINPLERHLISKWKMGPVMRRQEITRLVQGMGRCTRSATDYAVVLWLGQALADKAASSLTAELPYEIRQELEWGIEQQGEEGSSKLVAIATGLIQDPEYRNKANESISEISRQATAGGADAPNAGEEVRFARATWDGDYGKATTAARAIADAATTSDGSRAWWWYMASTAAKLAGNVTGEVDFLKNSNACGINSAFTGQLLSWRRASLAPNASTPEAEQVWDLLTAWGWQGKRFEERITEMLAWVGSNESTDFHRGVERLGACLGAKPERLTETGCPDCVWYFGETFVACFEAKTKKKHDGRISKSDLQEAKGHPEWTMHRHPELGSVEYGVVIVSPSSAVHTGAEAFINGVNYLAPGDLRQLADRVAGELRRLRTAYAGREFAQCHAEFAAELAAAKLDCQSIKTFLLRNLLSSPK